MKTVDKAVKITDKETGKLRTVATIAVQVFENIAEAVENLTEEVALRLLNKQHAIALQAQERSKHQETRAGKNARRTMAMNLLSAKDLAKYAGNIEKLWEYCDGPEMQARVDESLKVANALTAASNS